MKKVLLGFFVFVTVALSIVLIIYFKPIEKKANTTTTKTTTIATTNARVTNTTKANVTTSKVTEHSVSFDSDGGGIISSQTIINGNRISKPKDPTKEGHTFLGWFVNDELVDFDTYIVDKDITLEAKWSVNKYNIKSVLVHFNESVFEYEREYGSIVKSSVEELDFTYTPFIGWYLDDELISTDYNVEFVMPAKDVTLKAVCGLIDVEVEVINLGNGSGTVTGAGTYKYGDNVTLTATADEGSYFAGWNSIPYMPGNWLKNEYYEYASSANGVKVYVIFLKETREYTINHYIQKLDGSYEIHSASSDTAKIDEMTNAQPIVIEGFTPKEIEQKKMPVYNDLIVNIYYDRNEYDLTLKVNDQSLGSVSAKEKYLFGEAINIIVYPINGYVIYGWYMDGILVSTNPNYGLTMPSSNLELCAEFVINEHIEYKVNHLLKIDNKYILFDSEILSGTYLEMTKAVAKTSPSYTAYPFSQKVIDPSKSININIFYETNKYELNVSASRYYVLDALEKSFVANNVLGYLGQYTIYGYRSVYAGEMNVNIKQGKLYNSFYGVSKTYDEWIEFYDNPTDKLDYPYFIDENNFYNPSFYISDDRVDMPHEIPKDMDSTTGRLYSYVYQYLYDNYYDKAIGQYHYSTTDGEFYLGNNIENSIRIKTSYNDMYNTNELYLSYVYIKVELNGLILGEINDYDEFGIASNYTSTKRSESMYIKVLYDDFYERFITNSTTYAEGRYGKIHKEKEFYEYDEDVTLTAIPYEGYHFIGWYENDNLLSDELEYSFKMEDKDTQLIAKFVPDKMYKIEGDTLYFGYYPKTKEDNSRILDYIKEYVDIYPNLTEDNGWIKSEYGSVSEDLGMYIYYYYYLDINKDGTYDYFGVALVKELHDGSCECSKLWFKFEPIEWTILEEEDGKAMIISKEVIDCNTYNFSITETNVYEHNGGEGYPNNYELSDIRLWLNSYFINRAFNEYEQGIIQITTVNNGVDSTNNVSEQYTCNNTSDKVFLLSYSEVVKYFKTNESRQATCSMYSRIYGQPASTDGYTSWLLRSPSNNSNRVNTVNYQGVIYNTSKCLSYSHGIRPVMWIEL